MKRLNIEVSIKNIKAMLAITLVLLIFPGVVFAQERLSLTAGIANIRSGPGTEYDVLWQVEQYHPFIIIEKKEDWYKIKDFENDVAWLNKSLLGKIEGVITIKDKCNIRSKPGTKSQVLFTVEKGVPFKVLERKENWIKIEHADGDVGWIYKTLVW
ncbi:MAG: SH3 domain-containing protein [Deltaproteobacteria bacterium]|uniref:SH3 domain-containing protein n=1 Tax=Desulfobacula sp. TaxID=2593537 RepID=UPI0019A975DF|nr:SH3 domain-containing protein [Candidatus Desulfobacula maris]MBL6993613.1 SH3 domain-containing protein [Desulfobacula sp.]